MSTDTLLLSTKQALRVIAERYPGLTTSPQLMRQVKLKRLKVALVRGNKYYFKLSDVVAFEPHYEGQGRNPRPPTWNNDDLTITEAARTLGISRNKLSNLRILGKLQLEKKAGVYTVPRSMLPRIAAILKGETP